MGLLGDMVEVGVRRVRTKSQRENMKPEMQTKIDKVSDLARKGDVTARYAMTPCFLKVKNYVLIMIRENISELRC